MRVRGRVRCCHDNHFQCDEEVKVFLSEEHSFLEYEKMVLRYEELIQELQFGTSKVHKD